MQDLSEILYAALRRAADVDRRTVQSLTEKILREWLVGHAFLAAEKPEEWPVATVTGAHSGHGSRRGRPGED
jgi:predicted regulator of amino acid metabolism with ACT domain